MIDADDVIELKAMLHSCHPPLVSCLFMVVPFIKWIAPELSECGERIRRTSCHIDRITVLIKIKKLGMRPCVGTVHCNIYGYVTHYLYSLLIGISLECLPLSVEIVLLETVALDLVSQFLSVFVQC